MHWTPDEIGAAIGATGVVLVNNKIDACGQLTKEVAQARLALCLLHGTLTPPAEMWQVRVWLARNGYSDEVVTGIITAAVPAGAARDEALARWQHAPRVPKDSPLVALVAAQLGLDVAEIWWDILSI